VDTTGDPNVCLSLRLTHRTTDTDKNTNSTRRRCRFGDITGQTEGLTVID